jgi:hypothetical protein
MAFKGARDRRSASGLQPRGLTSSNRETFSMAFSYDQLVEALGPPDREESRTIPYKGARRSLTQRPPYVIPRAELYWGCGCHASMGMGESYRLDACARHPHVGRRSDE